jgi:SAM-dependent MidA family methyltransferase
VEFIAAIMPAVTAHTNLPGPDAGQRAHSERVRTALVAAINAAGGWLRFDDYLQCVLYAPGLGYYSAGAEKFGAVGDFITAPELSRLFGSTIARQCLPVLQSLRASGAAPEMLEFGAGSGRLAATVLQRLATLEALPERYFILEVSADLRQRQQTEIAQLSATLRERVRWIEHMPPAPFTGIMLANEVADALPFQRFVVKAEGVAALGVALDGNGQFCWHERAADAALSAEYQRVASQLPESTLPPGYASELCLLLDGWIAALAAPLTAGLILLADYGVGRRDYYHAERARGTLRCHYRHRAHDDPFLHPGLQDITAWVDFTRVAESASAAGLELDGYCTQTAFLLGAGITDELERASAAPASGVVAARLASEARQLLMPGEMGESFKMMALTRNLPLPLAGFGLQDLRRTL